MGILVHTSREVACMPAYQPLWLVLSVVAHACGLQGKGHLQLYLGKP